VCYQSGAIPVDIFTITNSRTVGSTFCTDNITIRSEWIDQNGGTYNFVWLKLNGTETVRQFQILLNGSGGFFYAIPYTSCSTCPTQTPTPTQTSTPPVTPTPTEAPIVYSTTIWFQNYQDGDPVYPYGYVDASTACSQGGNSGQFATVYYTGTLGNGTILYNYSNLTENFGYAGTIFYYWISGYRFTYDFGVIADYAACPTTYTIDYDFSQFAQSGEFSITVNGNVPVYATSTTSGQITVPQNAAIGVSVSAGATSPLIAQATLLIYNAGNLEYSNSTEGVPFAGLLHNYTATGNGTISASSSEF
jgi:hypothetical protein